LKRAIQTSKKKWFFIQVFSSHTGNKQQFEGEEKHKKSTTHTLNSKRISSSSPILFINASEPDRRRGRKREKKGRNLRLHFTDT